MALTTLQDIIDDTKSRLNEAQNSPLGGLATGTSPALALTTDAAITQLTNEALGDLCRFGGLAIPDQATGAQALGAFFVPYAGLTLVSGNSLWVARDVSFAGVRLIRIAPGQHAVKYSVAVLAGTPAEWAYQGADGFVLGPTPAAAGALAVRGLAVPKALAAPTDLVTPFLPIDLRRLLCYFNAYYLAIKNKEDATLLAAAAGWKTEYEAGKTQMLRRLAHLDPTTFQAFYAGGG